MLRNIFATSGENTADMLKHDEVIANFTRIRGVGKAIAEKLYDAGARTIEDILKLPGVPSRIKLCAKYVDELEEPILRGEATKIIKRFSKHFNIIPAGSYRRGKRSMHDIDIVFVGAATATEIIKQIPNRGIISSGDERATIILPSIHTLDIYAAQKDRLGAMLLYATGPGTWNIVMRIHARKRGLKLSQHGLFKDDKLIAAKTEEEIFEALDLPYVKPELRGDDEIMKKLFSRSK